MLKLSLLVLLIGLLALFAWANWPHEKLPADARADRILIEKSRRQLTLFAGDRPLRTYPVSLGTNPVGPKEREGDRKTPEGLYRVTEHKADSSYHLALRVSYPETKDIEHAAKLGVPPGFDIMIHGCPNGWGFIGRMQRWRDWTAGCIALTNPEIEEIFRVAAPDAVIEIRP
jgi:murein L,D-transpeptidase YafK